VGLNREDGAKTSVVNVSQLVTVDRDELVEKIGRLGAETIAQVCSGLELLFSRI